MGTDLTRLRNLTKENGSILPWMETPCWIWVGTTDKTGRPKFWLRDKKDKKDNSVTAQRAALILSGVTIEQGRLVMGVCGSRRCVRPSHLVTCTHKECQALKGRGSVLLGFGDILLIRQMIHDGEATAELLAEAYQVRADFIAAIAETG